MLIFNEILFPLKQSMHGEDAFCTLASLADDPKYQMDSLWRPSNTGIQMRFYQMERCVELILPEMSAHFQRNDTISASMYQAPQWFMTIFLATEMKFEFIAKSSLGFGIFIAMKG